MRSLRDRGQANAWAIVLYMILVLAILFGALVVFDAATVGTPGVLLP